MFFCKVGKHLYESGRAQSVCDPCAAGRRSLKEVWKLEPDVIAKNLAAMDQEQTREWVEWCASRVGRANMKVPCPLMASWSQSTNGARTRTHARAQARSQY